MPQITCVGILVADVVGKPIEGLPGRGLLQRVERMELHSGGCAANTGISLARLGISTAVIGKVGRDGFGDFLQNELLRAGIEAGGLARDDVAATSATMVMVHADGERTFLHYVGANGELRLEDVDMQRVRAGKLVHVAGTFLMDSFDGEPTAQLLKAAQESGVITSLDTAYDARGRWMDVLAPCMPYMDYFLPSFEEARMLAPAYSTPEDIARALIDMGVKNVALKLGERGSYVRSASGAAGHFPVIPVNVVDALGAGDAYVAGFLAGVVKGFPIDMCARLATAVGACCVTAMGATTGILSMEETIALLEKQTAAGAPV